MRWLGESWVYLLERVEGACIEGGIHRELYEANEASMVGIGKVVCALIGWWNVLDRRVFCNRRPGLRLESVR